MGFVSLGIIFSPRIVHMRQHTWKSAVEVRFSLKDLIAATAIVALAMAAVVNSSNGEAFLQQVMTVGAALAGISVMSTKSFHQQPLIRDRQILDR